MNILYFNSLEEYNTFVSTGSITKGGVTYTYNPTRDLYLVPVEN